MQGHLRLRRACEAVSIPMLRLMETMNGLTCNYKSVTPRTNLTTRAEARALGQGNGNSSGSTTTVGALAKEYAQEASAPGGFLVC